VTVSGGYLGTVSVTPAGAIFASGGTASSQPVDAEMKLAEIGVRARAGWRGWGAFGAS